MRTNRTELRQLTRGPDHLTPRWFPDGQRLRVGGGLIDFPDGLAEDFEPARAVRGGLPINGNASWSRDGRLIAQVQSGNVLTVSSQDRSFGRQIVSDAQGDPYRAAIQLGNRWLDNHRLIFWDLDLGNAFLWDTECRTLFRLRTEVDSDIWLLEMSKD